MTFSLNPSEAGSAQLLALGVGLALCASISFNLGLAIQKRSASKLPKVRGLRWSTLRAFCSSRAWLFGNALVATGWIVQFCALLLAPIGIVMPAVAAGIVFQPLLCALWLRERLSAIEWFGIGACSIGILMVAFSVDPHSEAASGTMNGVALSWVIVGLAAVALLAILAAQRKWARAETSLGAAAGLLYAGTGFLTKALGIVSVREGHFATALWIVVVMIALTAGALWIVQAAYQRGRALVIIPLMCMIADFLPALLGPFLFEEPWPGGERGLLRAAALVPILIGSFMLVSGARDPERLSAMLADELPLLRDEDDQSRRRR